MCLESRKKSVLQGSEWDDKMREKGIRQAEEWITLETRDMGRDGRS